MTVLCGDFFALVARCDSSLVVVSAATKQHDEAENIKQIVLNLQVDFAS